MQKSTTLSSKVLLVKLSEPRVQVSVTLSVASVVQVEVRFMRPVDDNLPSTVMQPLKTLLAGQLKEQET